MSLLNLDEYEVAARERMPAMFYDYIAGGANDEVTLRRNREAYDHILLRPRVLVDVEHIDLSTTLLGTEIAMPVLIAPAAAHRLACEEGELASTRAAHAMGTIATISTFSSYTIEQIAAASPGPLWFQLYVYRDPAITHHLIDHAIAGGAQALVITVDTPYLGHRERDLRNRFVLPPEAQAAHLATLPGMNVEGGSASSLRSFDLREKSMTWGDLDQIRAMVRMPIILKGILTPDDARIAVDNGIDGIIVSNHGGRQLDTCIPTIDALPEVAETVAGRIPVLIDGGIRRGTDVIKALSLGASAVMLARPVLWGLAVNGEAGTRHVLQLLHDEIVLAMGLCGKASIRSLDWTLLSL
ncbi:MAG TPA: alpha-hydroxy acid oxidase [Aggregatilineales bacterium]|nr:alpha-hydroxy acid oxidase [Aggregatilineales bacterium]